MEKKIVDWGYTGIGETKKETTIADWGYMLKHYSYSGMLPT